MSPHPLITPKVTSIVYGDNPNNPPNNPPSNPNNPGNPSNLYTVSLQMETEYFSSLIVESELVVDMQLTGTRTHLSKEGY